MRHVFRGVWQVHCGVAVTVELCLAVGEEVTLRALENRD